MTDDIPKPEPSLIPLSAASPSTRADPSDPSPNGLPAASAPKPEHNVLKPASLHLDPTLDNNPPLRAQQIPLHGDVKIHKPSPKHIIVLSFGSHAIRYGFAVDKTPRKVFPAVAFRRHPKFVDNPSYPPLLIPNPTRRPARAQYEASKSFDAIKSRIEEELSLQDRRRGGGRPIPWSVKIEPISADDGKSKIRGAIEAKGEDDEGLESVLVGHDVELLRNNDEKSRHYDILHPLWDGKVLFDCGAPASLVRKSLDTVLDYIVKQLRQERAKTGPQNGKGEFMDTGKPAGAGENMEGSGLFSNDGTAKTHVAVVVPETSQRRDVAEIVDAVFRTESLRTAAVFVHQSAVSCALGAGLATCCVVDIGHSATTVACIDDGMIMGETRVHLKYGSHHIHNAFDVLLEKSKLRDILNTEPGVGGKPLSELQIQEDYNAVIPKIAEQTGGFNVDENDSLTVAMIKLPSGRSLRVSLGVGIRSLPCYGLVHPGLLRAAYLLRNGSNIIPTRGLFESNSEDDNFVSDIFNDLRRSGIASAALPIGQFANDPGQPAAKTLNKEVASVVDAVIWSVGKAVEIKKPEQSKAVENYRRYVNAIVLAGGGASIDGIALALEARIKKGFLEIGLNVADVTVIDGGKGKGDEELAAAAAVLKDVGANGGLVDDTDTASLPWKGGAVMVEAEAVNDYWIYRDDWQQRNVRALRERAPFYW